MFANEASRMLVGVGIALEGRGPEIDTIECCSGLSNAYVEQCAAFLVLLLGAGGDMCGERRAHERSGLLRSSGDGEERMMWSRAKR